MTLKLVPKERTEIQARAERPCFLTRETVKGNALYSKTYTQPTDPLVEWFILSPHEAMLDIETLSEMDRFSMLGDQQ